jgi:hypothetical protein
MEQESQTSTNDEYPYTQYDPKWDSYVRIAGASGVGILILYILCSYLRDTRDFWTVFIAACLSFLILEAMVIQTAIYQKQWRAMRDGLAKTESLIGQNNEIIKAMNAQASHMEGQLKQANQHFYVSERAYVGIDNMGFDPPLVDGRPTQMRFTISNSGNTPAWDLTTVFALVTEGIRNPDRHPPVLPPNHPLNFIGQMTKGAPQNIWIPAPMSVDHWVMRTIREGTARLSITVKVRYTCIQDRQEEQEFFFIFDPPTGNFSRRRAWIPFTGRDDALVPTRIE